MSYKIFLFCLFIAGVYCTVDAQETPDENANSIELEILNHKTTKEIISKGRHLLWRYLQEDNKEKVQEIFFYLLEKEVDQRVSLYPSEKVLISYYIENYDLVFDQIGENSPILITRISEEYTPGIYLESDEITFGLNDFIHEREWVMIEAIETSYETNEHKDFLIIYLKKQLRNWGPYDANDHDDINNKADEFIQKYPDSPFKSYVKTSIRRVLVKSKWAVDANFYGGTSVSESDLNQYFGNFGSFGFSLGIFYQNFQFSFRDHIGISKLQDSIPFNEGVWKIQSKALLVIPEISLGHVIYDGKSLKVIPNIGVASTTITPSSSDEEDYPYYEDIGLKFTTTYTAGLTFDIKFGNYDGPALYPSYVNGYESHGFLRVRYTYGMPRFQERYNRFNGNMHTVAIGFGAYNRNYIRDDGLKNNNSSRRNLYYY